MKLKPWALIKIAVILFFTVGVVSDPSKLTVNDWGLGLVIAFALCFLALFQLAFWFMYDVLTLKRGGWAMPRFGDSPLTRQPGPGFHLNILAIALVIMGAAKIVAAIFQGVPAVILGTTLLILGALLLVWQILLRKLFKSRFAGYPPSNINMRQTR